MGPADRAARAADADARRAPRSCCGSPRPASATATCTSTTAISTSATAGGPSSPSSARPCRSRSATRSSAWSRRSGPRPRASRSATRGSPFPGSAAGTARSAEHEREQWCMTPKFLGARVPGGYSDHVIVPHPRYLIAYDGRADAARLHLRLRRADRLQRDPEGGAAARGRLPGPDRRGRGRPQRRPHRARGGAGAG